MTLPTRISLLFLMLLAVPTVTALEGDRQQQLVIEADELDGDEQAQITRLNGNVLLQQGTLDIRADTAVLYGPVKSLERVVVEGNPAILDQELEDRDGRLHAEADRVDYDLVARRLELTGNAVVDQGNRHLTGDRIVYDLAADRVIGEGRGEPDGDRVRIRIDPEDGPDNN